MARDDLPTWQEILSEEIGIKIPEDADMQFWQGVSPHLFDLLAVWAFFRVASRFGDWIQSGLKDLGAAAGDLIPKTGGPAFIPYAATSWAGVTASIAGTSTI
jgi:hypothetical protein